MTQPLFTDDQRAQLLANGQAQQAAQRDGGALDLLPVVKLFTPDAGATWLLSELDPEDETRAFGLCDLGVGCPELGWVDLGELGALRGPFGLPVERDLWFTPDRPISQYLAEALEAGRITA